MHRVGIARGPVFLSSSSLLFRLSFVCTRLRACSLLFVVRSLRTAFSSKFIRGLGFGLMRFSLGV